MDKSLVQLGVCAMKKVPYSDFSVEDTVGTFRDEVKKLAGTPELFRRNYLDVYELMEKVIYEVLPQSVADRYGMFSNILFVDHNVKAVFKKKIGRARAKRFITKVGLGGIFETFRLDSTNYEVPTVAIGGAAVLDWERFLSGEEDFAEYLDIIMEGLDEQIGKMIAEAMKATMEVMPAANTHSASSTDEKAFGSLMNTVRAYGDPVIVCTRAFAETLPYNTIGTSANPDDLNDLRNYGILRVYHGAPIVILPQSFEDANNKITVVDDSICYIVPGLSSKLVDLVFEGTPVIDTFKNKDRSMELSVYMKAGVAVPHSNNWAIYENTSL